MGKATEAGKTFLAGVLAKLPESVRAQAETIFNGAEAEAALTTLGDGVLARSDYSRLMDELTTEKAALTDKYNELNTWYGANKAALDEYVELKRATDGAPPKKADDAHAPDPRQIALDVVNEAGQEYVQVSAWLAGKAVEHFHRFGEALDVMALTANPKLGKPVAGQPGRVFSLPDAYNEAYGERVRVKEKEAEDQRINKLVEERLSEERKKAGTHPFPIRGAEPSPLDALADPERSKRFTLDAAVEAYEALQAGRGV